MHIKQKKIKVKQKVVSCHSTKTFKAEKCRPRATPNGYLIFVVTRRRDGNCELVLDLGERFVVADHEDVVHALAGGDRLQFLDVGVRTDSDGHDTRLLLQVLGCLDHWIL